MALININEQILSDLVVHEQDPSVGYARRVVNVAGAAATLKLNSLLLTKLLLSLVMAMVIRQVLTPPL